MLVGIQELLINLMFVLLPLFLTQVFWLDRPNRNTNPGGVYIGVLSGISAILCMSVPYRVTDEYFMDLRMVPLTLSFLYGGYRSGLITAAMVIGFRLYLEGNGIYGTIMVTALVSALSAAVYPYSRGWVASTRITTAVVLSFCGVTFMAATTRILYPGIFLGEAYRSFIMQYAAVLSAGMWISAYFIELIIRNFAMRQMLEQSKKMKLVSELAASVSHEVRNPLTVTRGFIQLLRRDGLPQDKRAAFINLALEELDRAESIISDYLSLAKPQMEKIEDLNVFQEVRYVADVISPYAVMKTVDVHLHLDQACLIRGEKDKFRQCLINLAKNAVEAMPNGGTLEITVTRRSGKAEIVLEDTGVGMTPEQIGRLGTPYYSTKVKGTGLGTMLVFSFIKAMGGKIDVQSKLGSGTCFTLTLPSEPA